MILFQLAFLIYDSAVDGNDKQMANALWRRFLMGGENPDPEKVELLVSYVRRSLSVLDHVDINTLIVKETFDWLPLRATK